MTPPSVSTSTPDPTASDDAQALLALEQSLRDALAARSWLLLAECPLLAEHDEDALRLTEREMLVDRHLPSIAEITHRFVTRLSERAELVPVGRVRRPASRAFERLAGHTEDWAARSLSGPIPRQALAVTRIENADLYENRMVCELIHPILTSHLAGRLRKLRRMESDLLSLTAAPHEGTYRRQQRLYEFWGGDLAKAERAASRAKATLQALEGLFDRVNRLRSAPLATELRGRTTGRRRLRLTNVLADDPRYHAAGLVWQAYEGETDEAETAGERATRIENSHDLFAGYVLAMLVRALESLSARPNHDDLPPVVGGWNLHGPWGPAVMRLAEGGVVLIESAGRVTRFVPLLDLIRPDEDDAALLARWTSHAPEAGAREVVVYLGPSARVAQVAVGARSQLISSGPDAPNGDPDVSGIPVSPLESTSLERLSRAMSRAILEPALLAYPPKLTNPDGPVPQRLLTELAAAGIGRAGLSPLFFHPNPRDLHVRRPMLPTERTAFQHWFEALVKRIRGVGWERDFDADIQRVPSALDRALAAVAPLLTCPMCAHPADPGRLQREGYVFTISCPACRGTWGLERCGRCGDRMPIIEPIADLRNPEVSGPGWVERIFGQDALASPCWARTTVGRYVCPACGACSGTDGPDGAACVRCRAGSSA